MNRLEVMQTGGFPLETDTLDFMQKTYELLNNLGYLAGDLTIINGCDVNGTSTGDGVVFMNGELLPFVGGITQSRVVIVEEPTTRNFEDGSTKVVFKNRYVTFGNGSGSQPWNEFTRIEPLKLIMETVSELKARMLPVLTNPILWSGNIADIPTGYQLCDGTNGTPDLRKKFIVGYDSTAADYNTIGKTGGEEKHTLTTDELPKLEGTFWTVTPTGDNGTGIISAQASGDAWIEGKSAPGWKHKIMKISFGNNQPHENRPPFYTLAYIIWVGI